MGAGRAGLVFFNSFLRHQSAGCVAADGHKDSAARLESEIGFLEIVFIPLFGCCEVLPRGGFDWSGFGGGVCVCVWEGRGVTSVCNIIYAQLNDEGSLSARERRCDEAQRYSVRMLECIRIEIHVTSFPMGIIAHSTPLHHSPTHQSLRRHTFPQLSLPLPCLQFQPAHCIAQPLLLLPQLLQLHLLHCCQPNTTTRLLTRILGTITRSRWLR